MKKRKHKDADAGTQAQPADHHDTPAELASEHVHQGEHEFVEPDPDADELTRVTLERDKAQDQLQRTLADLQNFRKRRAQEMTEVRQAAVEGLASELLPVLDNFHLATEAARSEDGPEADGAKAVREGLAMVKAMLESVLERHGLREIEALGQPFDHAVHEAVGLTDADNVPAGHIAQVVQKGYHLGDRVLRHAKVLVAGDAPEQAEERDSEG